MFFIAEAVQDRPTLWCLYNENFIEGILDRGALDCVLWFCRSISSGSQIAFLTEPCFVSQYNLFCYF